MGAPRGSALWKQLRARELGPSGWQESRVGTWARVTTAMGPQRAWQGREQQAGQPVWRVVGAGAEERVRRRARASPAAAGRLAFPCVHWGATESFEQGRGAAGSACRGCTSCHQAPSSSTKEWSGTWREVACPVQGPQPCVAIGVSVNSVKSNPQFNRTSHLSSAQQLRVAGDCRVASHIAASWPRWTQAHKGRAMWKWGPGMSYAPSSQGPVQLLGAGRRPEAECPQPPREPALPTPPELLEKHVCCLKPPVCGHLLQRPQETCRQGPGLELKREKEPGAFGNELGSMCEPGKGVENLCLMDRQLLE